MKHNTPAKSLLIPHIYYISQFFLLSLYNMAIMLYLSPHSQFEMNISKRNIETFVT